MFGSDTIRIKIKGYLKNNTENQIFTFEEKGIKNKNKITYSSDNVKHTIKVSDSEIILIREGEDFINTFIFNKKRSKSNYFLKENNCDVDLEIITTSLDITPSSIFIEYEVLDSGCKYEYKIEMSDIL